jgi:hypothetical protein
LQVTDDVGHASRRERLRGVAQVIERARLEIILGDEARLADIADSATTAAAVVGAAGGDEPTDAEGAQQRR